MDEPVVIAAFRSWDEAAGAKGALEYEGIAAEAAPRREGVARMCADAFADGFDVTVDAADAERGIAVLRSIWPDEVEPKIVEQCPACGSVRVAHLPRLRIFIVVALAMVVLSLVFGQRNLFLLVTAIIAGLLILTPRRWCRECGERW